SAASMTVKVVTMGIGVAAGVAINAYLQNNAIKELSDKTGSEIDVLAAEIVDKNEGIRSSMKQVSKEIISTYNSLETERIVRKNIKVTEHKVY
ncbi:MAG TPA: hypothetical protein PLX56_12315, partial [bacterium]|nr:hypothetical protein [bacterium]